MIERGQMPVLFLVCPLPVRAQAGQTSFVRSTVRVRFRLTSTSRYGIPHGADRMILLLIATLAADQKSKQLDLGTAGDILRFFGLAADGRNYERLARRFDRVLSSSLEFRFHPLRSAEAPRARSMTVCGGRQMWFEQHGPEKKGFRNSVVLSDDFWGELQRSKVIVPLAPYLALLDSPANLDLYLFMLAQSQSLRTGQYARIPITGPDGLGAILGVSGYEQARDFRRKVRAWLERVRLAWRSCPAIISSDEQYLFVGHSSLKVQHSFPET
ncbi:MAG: replication protein RepA [Bryobacteraceae bacterium]